MGRLRIIYGKSGKKMAEFINGELAWHSDEYAAPQAASSPMIMSDIQPYISQIDGSVIESRSRHREHLKSHGCIEIGNETKHLDRGGPMKAPPGLKQQLIDQVNHKLR